MNKPHHYDPIRYLRDKGVTVRLGLPQGGKQKLELDFSRGYWEPHRVLAMYQLVQNSEKLIRLQLDVEKGLPPQSIESLLAKGYVKIEEQNGQRRYVITEAGRRRRGW